MADITIPADKAQAAMDAIGSELFALESDPNMKVKLAGLHAALAAGEALVVGRSNGNVKPQEGGEKPPPNS